MGRRHRSVALRAILAVLATLVVLAAPLGAAAHPLGNFTINHYAEVRIEPDRILLDVVIDHAEIPTFQLRQRLDTDGDGMLSESEIESARAPGCEALAGDLVLSVDGQRMPLGERLVAAGLSFPPGVGGLQTTRQVCVFDVPLPSTIGGQAVSVAFSDSSYDDRLGWREIVARGSAVTLTAVDGELRDTSLSGRLSAYPEDRLAAPLAQGRIEVDAVAGGPTLDPFVVQDALPVAAAGVAGPPPTAPGGDLPAGIPGGLAGELPEIFRTADLTPLLALLSVITAAGLGAGHALTPGHGKTLMAAYLVGTRGSVRHALGLGIAVSVSHTLGILALALLVIGATEVVAPDLVVRLAPVVAAVSIVLIGGWMLVGEVRRRMHGRAHHEHDHPHEHDHSHEHDHPHEHAHGPGHAHTHEPPGSTITWKGLFALGLAGGLIPSTSALLILLGSIAAGRPGFGIVLVTAFGLGMAAVMGGIGFVLVVARDRVDRLAVAPWVERVRATVPLAAAVVVLGFGAVLTVQAVSAVAIA